MGMPLDEARPGVDGTREALKICIGLGTGLIPAASAVLFYATLCPYGPDVTPSCHEPTNGLDVDFFVGAVIGYLLQVVVAVVFLIVRAMRPVGLGLAIMLVVGPLVALVGIGYVAGQKVPHPTNFGENFTATLHMLPRLGRFIARDQP